MAINEPDWIPFYNELLNKICKNYDAESLYSIWSKYFPNKYKDISKMDPFTFIARTLSRQKENKFKKCEMLKNDFGLKSDIPTHYEEPNGMPSLKGAYTFFCKSYRNLIIKDNFKEYEAYKKALSPLWDLAKQVIDNNINPETYNQCIKLTNAGPQLLTQIIFICNPNTFYSLDEINQNYLKDKEIQFNLESSYDSFIDFQLKAKQINPIPYEFSIEAYTKTCEQPKKSDNPNGDKPMSKPTQPLNQILYGPPGTGKTYNTIVKAIQILDEDLYLKYEAYLKQLEKNPKFKIPDDSTDYADYKTLQKKYNDLKNDGRIEFITFHQSYSYEEFVEGIKPDLQSNDLKYVKQSGIFKQICEEASIYLYKPKENKEKRQVSFDDIIETFKEKYPQGCNCLNLKNISFNENNEFVYHFGKQDGERKIDLAIIKTLLEKNMHYKTAINFNADYQGNTALKGYNHNFYKELVSIKNELENDNQKFIENSEDFEVDKNAPKFVLIIDEINRGNISKIFGELITLIEPDKRKGADHELRVKLPYSPEDEPFGVPNNLYIIGTMNTADRSIALLDTALRRRFDFEEMPPRPDLLVDKEVANIKLKDLLEKLNKNICEKGNLDKDHKIGHAFLINTDKGSKDEQRENLKRAFLHKIYPLLEEYFYGEENTIKDVLNIDTKIDDLSKYVKENWHTVLENIATS